MKGLKGLKGLKVEVRHNGLIPKVEGDDILIDNFNMPTLRARGAPATDFAGWFGP